MVTSRRSARPGGQHSTPRLEGIAEHLLCMAERLNEFQLLTFREATIWRAAMP
jgi:hypothetical protein